MLLIQVFCAVISSYGWLKIQQRFKLGTKTMFNATAVLTTACSVWDMIGNCIQKFGFHKIWEFWFFQVYWGLSLSPFCSYSNTMVQHPTLSTAPCWSQVLVAVSTHAPRERSSLLFLLRSCWHNIVVHRPLRSQCHYRNLEQQQLGSVLFSLRIEYRQVSWHFFLCRHGEKPD